MMELQIFFVLTFSCFKLHNYEQQMGEAGFNLIQKFKPQLEKAIAQHGAIKVYPSAY